MAHSRSKDYIVSQVVKVQGIVEENGQYLVVPCKEAMDMQLVFYIDFLATREGEPVRQPGDTLTLLVKCNVN